ncbi:MAG: hypothetical protein J5653_03225 [Clostridiales bacterium]|nr:hypothetical protein [Clostridiales bacterium]
MESVKGMKTRKILSLLLALLVLFVISFSSFYIAVEANHECDGHDCPICSILRQCEAVIRVFKEGKTQHTAPVLPVLIHFAAMHLIPALITSETPVSRKVQLNN